MIGTHDLVGTSETVIIYNYLQPTPPPHLEPGQIKVELRADFPIGASSTLDADSEIIETRLIPIGNGTGQLTISYSSQFGYGGSVEMYGNELQFVILIGASSVEEIISASSILATLEVCTFELAQ